MTHDFQGHLPAEAERDRLFELANEPMFIAGAGGFIHLLGDVAADGRE